MFKMPLDKIKTCRLNIIRNFIERNHNQNPGIIKKIKFQPEIQSSIFFHSLTTEFSLLQKVQILLSELPAWIRNF